MRISTAEIKMLIKKCVSNGGTYTVEDLKNYITANSDKEMTRGQLSGAVFQLADAKEIIRVERGLYSKNVMSAFNEESTESQENSELKEELYKTLNKIEKELINVIGNVDIWNLSGEEFELITKVRELKSAIAQIKAQCK
ncbi:hypothetical protein [Clostridium fessum]|uniref:hypothetical protein n=2 Tax=Bacillota TaxID=1239 RepID=UPI002941DC1C|nr:hypothetical protein [Clostridium fessum]